jgi:hypothetical protein
MKEEKIEKIRSKEPLEEIKAIKAREMKAMKEDKLYSSPWKLVNPENLIPDNLQLFGAFSRGQLETAQALVLRIRELLANMKDRRAKTSNQAFWDIFNGLIEKKIEEARNRLEIEKDSL